MIVALAQFQSQQKSVTISDIDHEETLLEETATREETYLNKIARLENELRTAQKECEMNRSDLEKLQSLYASNSELVKDLEGQKRHMREELKDLKGREQRLMNEYAELEEENIGLQKQASNLRSAQVEFEAMKMEVKRLLDENDQLLADRKEANQLTMVAEKQLEDALLNIQLERDQKLAYKKELDQMRNAEHLQQLNSMLFGFQSNSDEDSQALKQLESSFIAEGNGFGRGPSKGADLFSEINGDMEEKVSELENKNDELSLKLKDVLRDIAFVTPLLRKLEVTNNAEVEHNQLKQLCELALSKIDELSESAAKVEFGEKNFGTLKSDLRVAVMAAGAYYARIAAAQDQMIAVADFLYRIYHQLVTTNGLETDKNASEVMKKLRQYAKDNAESEDFVQVADEGVESGTETENGQLPRISLNLQRHVLSAAFLKALNEKLAGQRIEEIVSEGDMRERIVPGDGDIFKVSESLIELTKIVRRTVESAMNARVEAEDNQELALQNMKLRSQLATKREQIVTLRTVLRSNKQTAESALASLKEKYESEKAQTHDILEKHRRELKAFKEDAATFASHRAMFTARCEELQAEVDELKANQKAAEEEKKTLNSLLRMAIQQKLALTQRLEELEVDRERQTFKRGNKATNRPSGDMSSQLHRVRYPPQNSQQQRNLKRDY
ncbi:unnamed protein product [Enterobius vermicularis]|uniref:Dynactin domain-containing protein n=1 Tax=Enterobius vermicularis TaxID=51028 RepID=A0A0N4VMK5_ENTVE|nr:unnamed protein product [Enterobius vermicularis]